MGSHNFTNGASFASAGAAVLVETNPSTKCTNFDIRLSLVALYIRIQLGYLKEVANLLKEELGDIEAKNILENAIYLSSFGGVDYMAFIDNTYTHFTQSKMEEYVKMVLGNLTEVTKKICISKCWTFGCQPELKQQYSLSGKACVEELQTIASQHHNALSNVTRELESQLSGFNYMNFDFFNALNDMTSYLENYGSGFKVSDIACCGTGSHRGPGCGRVTAYELCSDLILTRNNNFLNVSSSFKANFPPYGETFFKYPTGRFCDGRNIPDFTALHANLSLWRPYLSYQPGKHQFLNGANFASAGAPVLSYVNPKVLPLDIQLGFFKNIASLWRQELGDAVANKRLNNAVVLISIGGIDYFAFWSEYPNATESEKQEYVNWVIGNITYTITEIYETGGRKFAFQNVAPLGCSPEAKQTSNLSDDECVEELLEMATLHNNALFNAAKELEIQLPAFKYLIFDYYNLLYDRIKHPSKYGFEVSNIACCGSGAYRGTDCGIGEYELCSDPNEYLFFDGDHLSERAYSQLSELLWSGGKNVTAPLNMKQLIALEELDQEIVKFTDHVMKFSI
ncbi:hypothetical protein LWI29_019045 [Acer saccharum]|uniref:Uncharacterized protein n=1 Tax=Acer saccharum TaxID=4024 RepID=A0AA39VS31_ACESA|nr:hypothetical protein LWI29_019045 [Acer saccharum]